jgi:hypothetical protein
MQVLDGPTNFENRIVVRRTVLEYNVLMLVVCQNAKLAISLSRARLSGCNSSAT